MYTYDFTMISTAPAVGQKVAFSWGAGCWYVGEVIGDVDDCSATVRIGMYEDTPDRVATIGFDNLRHLSAEDADKPVGFNLQIPY